MQSFRPSTIRAPMLSAVLVLLAVTPVSLSVDLSRAPIVEAIPAPEPEPGAPPPREKGLRLGAGLRLSILVRANAVDPTLAFHGALPTGVVEPLVTMGLVFAPAPALTAWELPLTAMLQLER